MKGTEEKTIATESLLKACEGVHEYGDRMQMAYAWHPDRGQNPEVLYLASVGSKKPFHLWRCRLDESKQIPSLANISPLLGWYEREMKDLFGVSFSSHPELYPLVLHEGAKPSVPPLCPAYSGENPVPFSQQPLRLLQMDHADVQHLPFGPVRASVCESAQFMYLYAGETILHFYQRLFFKHRGMEKRFEGLSPELGAILAERVSGTDSVAHALAFCQALETACDCEIPQRAKQWRVILAELERLYNHLSYLGYLCHTTTLKVGEAEGRLLEEQLKQLNAKISGSRFLREVIAPGGLRREPQADELQKTLPKLYKQIKRYCKYLSETNTHLDRLIGTGILKKQTAFELGATGPVSRASGIEYDFRVDHPYAAYGESSFKVPMTEQGDANDRMSIRILEIEESFNIIKFTLNHLVEGPLRSQLTVVPQAEGLGWTESSRGGLFYAVHLDQKGQLARVKIKTPSFSNWRVFPFTVNNTNMMDYAINEASFGSTIADCDR